MAVGSAASLLAAMLVSGSGAGARLAGWWRGTPASVSPVTGELAAAWSETRQELSAASDASLWYPEHLDALAGQQIGQGADDSEESNPDEPYIAAAPSWMTAAVRSSAGLAVDGDTVNANATPFDGESQEN